jgi:hypothetical protein
LLGLGARERCDRDQAGNGGDFSAATAISFIADRIDDADWTQRSRLYCLTHLTHP